MKNKNLKSDIVAEYIVTAFSYIAKNKITFLVVIAGISTSIWYFYPSEVSKEDMENSKQAGDAVILKKILDDQIDNSIQESDEVGLNQIIDVSSDYDAAVIELDGAHKSNNYYKLSTSNDSLFMEFSDLIEQIDNKTLKTLYLLREGDINSDNGDFGLAKSSYQSAISSSGSDALKGYANYKIGIIYFELKEFDNALSSFENATELFDKSQENTVLNNNQQFSAWMSRNNTALAKVKNILKK